MTDDELMTRVAQGDEGAFRLLVERWEQPIYGFLLRMVGVPEEALDLSQETFLRVHAQAGRYRGADRFRSWLLRIAGNLARSRLRRRRILRWVPFDVTRHDRAAPIEAADARRARGETRQAVRRALARLPVRQRQAVVLKRYQGLRYREIAAVLGTTVPGVESLLQRAMRTLRKELAEERVAP